MSGGKQARSCSGHAVVAADNAQNRFQVAISNLSDLLLGIEPQFYLIVANWEEVIRKRIRSVLRQSWFQKYVVLGVCQDPYDHNQTGDIPNKLPLSGR